MFYKVQNSIKGGDEVNKVVREWTDHKDAELYEL